MIEDLLLHSMIFMSRGYLPPATSLLRDATGMMTPGHIYISLVEKKYEELLHGPYSKSKEVADLGLGLLTLQMPHLFSN